MTGYDRLPPGSACVSTRVVGLFSNQTTAIRAAVIPSFGEACRHTRTRIDPRDKDNPLQVDYLFASDGLIANPYVCGTLDQEEWAEYSDHAPIIATFEADSPGSEG